MNLTEAQAIALYMTGFWKEMSAKDRARFQLNEPRLCMPFDVFHAAVASVLGRGVYNHEFADPQRLLSALLGDKPAPSFEAIVALIPKEKRVVLEAPKAKVQV